MLSLGSLLPSRSTLMLGVAGLVALSSVAIIADERGASRERAACLAREFAERRRQAQANDAAREASRGYALATLHAERRTAQILDEVANVPTSDPPRCGLGAERVRRLNQLR